MSITNLLNKLETRTNETNSKVLKTNQETLSMFVPYDEEAEIAELEQDFQNDEEAEDYDPNEDDYLTWSDMGINANESYE